jgi:ATPase domain predominantly from Archaea
MPTVDAPSLAVQFVKNLKESGFRAHRNPSSDDDFDVHYLDLTPLKIRSGYFTPFLIPRRNSYGDVSHDQYLAIVDKAAAFFAHQTNSNFVVLLAGGQLTHQDEELRTHAAAKSVAILERGVMDAIATAPKGRPKERALGTTLGETLGLVRLSPYVIGKHATGSRFFGRRTQINKLMSGRQGGGCTIVGNRRIGKTSLLKEVQRRMMSDDPSTLVADIYGGAKFQNTYEVLSAIIKALQPQARLLQDREPNLIRNFSSYIRALADRERRSVAVFIDELDGLLTFDAEHNYELLDILRGAFDHERCRIFFAGFRITMEAKANDRCPLHNFGRLVALGPLSREETVEMINKPMENLGVDLSDSDLTGAIYSETAGQPELIQYCGAELAHYYVETGQIPDATTLLTRVVQDRGYEQAIFGSFLQNSTARERLACYLLIANAEHSSTPLDSYEFGMATIDGLFQKQKVSMDEHDLYTLISNLQVGGITTPVEGKQHEFRFSVPQFARYCMNLDLSFLTGKALHEVKRARTDRKLFPLSSIQEWVAESETPESAPP